MCLYFVYPVCLYLVYHLLYILSCTHAVRVDIIIASQSIPHGGSGDSTPSMMSEHHISLQPPVASNFKSPDEWSRWRLQFEQFRIVSGLADSSTIKQVSSCCIALVRRPTQSSLLLMLRRRTGRTARECWNCPTTISRFKRT